MRLMGFDEVYDTNFGADLTVMEESKELMEKLEEGKDLPLFTSCCPAWVKFCEEKYPELKAYLFLPLSAADVRRRSQGTVQVEQGRRAKDRGCLDYALYS